MLDLAHSCLYNEVVELRFSERSRTLLPHPLPHPLPSPPPLSRSSAVDGSESRNRDSQRQAGVPELRRLNPHSPERSEKHVVQQDEKGPPRAGRLNVHHGGVADLTLIQPFPQRWKTRLELLVPLHLVQLDKHTHTHTYNSTAVATGKRIGQVGRG